MGLTSSELGRRLFVDVETYGARPSHRTGTVDDAATIEWFSSLLRADGATVDVESWTFPRWTAEWSAELRGANGGNDDAIDSLPLFYETVGSFAGDEIDVVPTENPGGFLSVKNRRATLDVPKLARATLQVPGHCIGRKLRVRIDNATVVEGVSANVLAGYGCSFANAEILIATPLSGWFHCASERGTGISIARWLAHTLAEQGHRVGLLGTSGHELFNLGLEHHLLTHSTSAKVIVHIGASVGARSPDSADALSDSLYATSNVDGVGSELASIGYHQRVASVDPKQWIGEGTRWCTLGLPLLSVAGMSHWFHSPQDTADRTSPELLERVARALLADVWALIERVGVGG
jgi:hypothetical protein